MQRSLLIRLVTFLVWLAAAACVVYWALKFVKGPQAPLGAALAAPTQNAAGVDPQALAKGLGGAKVKLPQETPGAAPVASAIAASRFVLTGVAADRGDSGVALLSVDSKPPRPYAVGAQLADGVVLHSVSQGKAMLAVSMQAPVSVTLELPKLNSAVAGTAVILSPLRPPGLNQTAVQNLVQSATSNPVQNPSPGPNSGQSANLIANPNATPNPRQNSDSDPHQSAALHLEHEQYMRMHPPQQEETRMSSTRSSADKR